MPYEIKGRIERSRPIRNDQPKREPRERVVYQGPLNPRLRPKDGFVHAIGFTAQLLEADDD